jgi:hypothetical protein
MSKLILRWDADDIAAENLFLDRSKARRESAYGGFHDAAEPCSFSRSVQHPTSRRESAHARNSERRRAPSTS